jgi:hypothetical protein
MGNKRQLLHLQSEYKGEIQMCKDFIITRLENASLNEEFRVKNLTDPFSIDCVLMDGENQIDHTYDCARMGAFQRCLSDVEYLLAYEA